MSGAEQATFGDDGTEPARRLRPKTLIRCYECHTTLLRSERFDHDHDLSGVGLTDRRGPRDSYQSDLLLMLLNDGEHN